MAKLEPEALLDHAYQKVAEAYLVIGALSVMADDGSIGDVTEEEWARALDYFANCEGPAQEDFLPWPRTQPERPGEPG